MIILYICYALPFKWVHVDGTHLFEEYLNQQCIQSCCKPPKYIVFGFVKNGQYIWLDLCKLCNNLPLYQHSHNRSMSRFSETSPGRICSKVFPQ